MTPSPHRSQETAAISLAIENRQPQTVDLVGLEARLRQAIALETGVPVTLVIALVDDAGIQRVHRDFLNQPTATDVISFAYHVETPGRPEALVEVDGELVVSVETATRQAREQGWSLDAELLLYCVHGFLHLCGYDDLTDDARRIMRQRERLLMSPFGWLPANLED